jgi:deoxyribodipyrimidine photo-lyase
MPNSPSILWFRRDLRLNDNPALLLAAKQGGPVIPLFIWSPTEGGKWSIGEASKWWLHHALQDLALQLAKRKSQLIIREGEAAEVLVELVKEVGAQSVFWNRLYEPDAIARDQEVKERLQAIGAKAQSSNASLLYEPWQILNKADKPFQVFTPFWKSLVEKGEIRPPAASPSKFGAPSSVPASLTVDQLNLLPKPNWATTIEKTWNPKRSGAEKALKLFCGSALDQYSHGRDFPDREEVSYMSPYLHFGQIGVLEIWHQVKDSCDSLPARERSVANQSAQAYLREIGWREFAHHLLFHFPFTTDKPLRSDFSTFPWRKNKELLTAWQKGQTGFPMVDAGMRQLWAAGWMHNRVRMIVASFLVKDLLIGWKAGASWFWDTLVDADLANNTLGWQWTAGCGADAQPYFRIFNPVSQGQKFDPQGKYVRTWVPELAELPDEVIHCPWQADSFQLAKANVKLGINYPEPIVDHSEARKRALAAFKSMKEDN